MTRALISAAELSRLLGLHEPTAEQAAVISSPLEPAVVIAGAGSGKTETMAARVVWLVANGIVTPDRVLGLTFTRKAARQLSDRVRARLRRLAGSQLIERVDPTGQRRQAVLTSEPTILTYHAYAGRIVSEHGLRLPVEPGARLLTETAAWQVAHHVVSTWAEDIDTDKVPPTITGYLLKLAGEFAEHLVDPDRLREHAERLTTIIESAPKTPKQRDGLSEKLKEIVAAQRFRVELLPLVDAYAQAKRKLGALDFADQMALAATLASEHPEVAFGERERYGAVLLDEYQDTGHSQRVLLRSLFGQGVPLPVTAVGDPAQAIYGWRGASAANLPRFTTDFPRIASDRTRAPAARFGLLTSFRNPGEVLELANLVAAPLRRAGLDVDDLRSRDDAPAGDVACALLTDIRQERVWLAAEIAKRWRAGIEEHDAPPTAAVLVRRRADMADLAAALRAEGIPVEVVGIGGLLAEPEIRDLVSTLRLLVDPLAGTAAMRLLTNSRWRIGAADLAALHRRAMALAGDNGRRGAKSEVDNPIAVVADAMPTEHAEQTGLADALDDPGEPTVYSVPGFRRIADLGDELAALRRRLEVPLPELVADVERTLMLDIEAMARPGGVGRVHLDAFADVVAEFAAASPSATLPALLDYLGVAERAEDGLTPGEVQVADNRVQILTVHAAKGLEWEIVAVPHLVAGVFPGKRRSSSWLRSITELPADLRGDAEDLPTLQLMNDFNRKEVEVALVAHDDAFEARRLVEERRLCYVALTRAEHTLLVSGHWWGESGTKPRGPSAFLHEIHAGLVVTPTVGTVAEWADQPDEDAENPLAEYARTMQWPADPLGERRFSLTEGAELVRTAMAADTAGDDEYDEDGWARDVDVLLAERAAAASQRERVLLPAQLTVSQLVELADDPDGLARRLRRPLPFPPNPSTRRGTAFHGWLEERFSASRLIDVDELPGSADQDDVPPDTTLTTLQAAFLASAWADRMPYDVEVPFETEISGVTVRGRMDAVFRDEDGGWTVVDWKTGALPDEGRLPALAVQLAAYRLAWASLADTDVGQVRAAFHYVAHDSTVRPVDLLDAEGLRRLLAEVPEQD
ncbi:MAG TPA: UvrD-helicase domain-containing protein [Pseudonocardiaceae bacterium]|nr:UvrD-helicase domain-containing protein [Pseudonocardiaceae bacterium]